MSQVKTSFRTNYRSLSKCVAPSQEVVNLEIDNEAPTKCDFDISELLQNVNTSPNDNGTDRVAAADKNFKESGSLLSIELEPSLPTFLESQKPSTIMPSTQKNLEDPVKFDSPWVGKDVHPFLGSKNTQFEVDCSFSSTSDLSDILSSIVIDDVPNGPSVFASALDMLPDAETTFSDILKVSDNDTKRGSELCDESSGYHSGSFPSGSDDSPEIVTDKPFHFGDFSKAFIDITNPNSVENTCTTSKLSNSFFWELDKQSDDVSVIDLLNSIQTSECFSKNEDINNGFNNVHTLSFSEKLCLADKNSENLSMFDLLNTYDSNNTLSTLVPVNNIKQSTSDTIRDEPSMLDLLHNSNTSDSFEEAASTSKPTDVKTEIGYMDLIDSLKFPGKMGNHNPNQIYSLKETSSAHSSTNSSSRASPTIDLTKCVKSSVNRSASPFVPIVENNTSLAPSHLKSDSINSPSHSELLITPSGIALENRSTKFLANQKSSLFSKVLSCKPKKSQSAVDKVNNIKAKLFTNFCDRSMPDQSKLSKLKKDSCIPAVTIFLEPYPYAFGRHKYGN